MKFKGCFSRQAAFKWFVVVIIGLMIRSDSLGVSSIIRALAIDPVHYGSLLHFFRSTSWNLMEIRRKWLGIVSKSGLIYRVHGKPLLIGDGVKQAKEGRKMPCVQKLGQDSENSSKPQYIRGHHFGAVGILIGTPVKMFCAMLSARIHGGTEVIGKWAGEEQAAESHVVRLVKEACRLASFLEPCRLALDSYFLTVPVLKALDETMKEYGHDLLTVVTRAKKNTVAYEKPPRKSKPGRGRPCLKGASVKLSGLFTSESASFQKASVKMYGKTETVEYLVKDLLWGSGLYRELRFVMVKFGQAETILVSTDAGLSPEAIIEIYALRFKIESCFREMKQVVAAFAYRFWSKAQPKLKTFAKNSHMTESLESISDSKQISAIVAAYNAIEGFAMFSVIAFGIIQLCSLRFAKQIDASALRWLRTKRTKIPSEATTADFMRKTFFSCFHLLPSLGIVAFIQALFAQQMRSVDSSVA